MVCAYSKFRHHPHPLGYLCAKFCFCRAPHCCASPWRKIAYSITHSPSLFDVPGTEAFAMELCKISSEIINQLKDAYVTVTACSIDAMRSTSDVVIDKLENLSKFSKTSFDLPNILGSSKSKVSVSIAISITYQNSINLHQLDTAQKTRVFDEYFMLNETQQVTSAVLL